MVTLFVKVTVWELAQLIALEDVLLSNMPKIDKYMKFTYIFINKFIFRRTSDRALCIQYK